MPNRPPPPTSPVRPPPPPPREPARPPPPTSGPSTASPPVLSAYQRTLMWQAAKDADRAAKKGH
jgi:hypothetical protein